MSIHSEDWDNKLSPCTKLFLSSNTMVEIKNSIPNFTTVTFKVILQIGDILIYWQEQNTPTQADILKGHTWVRNQCFIQNSTIYQNYSPQENAILGDNFGQP